MRLDLSGAAGFDSHGDYSGYWCLNDDRLGMFSGIKIGH